MAPPPLASMLTGWTGTVGTDAEEQTRGTTSYLDVLARLHFELSPTHYFEIGVRHGKSLSLARGPATGVDPAPVIECELPTSTNVFPVTSDEYFAFSAADIQPDLSFIDGKHLIEYALRDFMNIELRSATGAIVLIDDIFPNHPAQAERIRRTRAWTGDVWRLVAILRNYRPDLFLLPLDTSPAGSLLIAGIDSANRLLWDNYDTIAREVRDHREPSEDIINRQDAVDPTSQYFDDIITVLKNTRASQSSATETVARLRLLRNHKASAVAGNRPRPKLSVVLIGYNMERELPRTIKSLSPAMQKNIDPNDYEVILVDNGSSQQPDNSQLRSLLPNLRTYRFSNPTVSPVRAINFGLSLARGDLVGVFIDGARMASPGLLAMALAASCLHSRPMIGTIAFHLGHEVQMESIKHGYNREVEDALLAKSGWEEDGYRLFEISTFAGSSAGGWFELPAESNAVFLRRDHWRALGDWDERFETPGGGLVNLDTWSRICADPEGMLIMLLGEATFHQVHGGIATNNLNPPQDAFHQEYVKIRGAPYTRPTRSPLYFGSLPNAMKSSLRSARGRRESRILCFFNHYWGTSSSFHGKSTTLGNREHRSAVVNEALTQIRSLPFDITIRVCGFNKESILPVDVDFSTIDDPRHLVYASIARMFDNIDEYDYFLNIEDDILIKDKVITQSINFMSSAQINEIYLPNRIELDGDGSAYCVDLRALPGWRGLHRVFEGIKLDVANNPNSGVSFLSSEQMRYARERVNLARRDKVTGGPIASAYANLHLPFLLWRANSDLLAHSVVHLDKWVPPDARESSQRNA